MNKKLIPIKYAPMDGQHILLFRPEIYFVGYYGGVNSGWRINAPGLPAIWPLPTHYFPLEAGPDLYAAVNTMMAEIGAAGELSCLHPSVTAVMNVLHRIDGGAPDKFAF